MSTEDRRSDHMSSLVEIVDVNGRQANHSSNFIWLRVERHRGQRHALQEIIHKSLWPCHRRALPESQRRMAGLF